MRRLIFVLLATTLLSACRSKTVYVPVESLKTEFRDRIERDSIYIKDSVFMKMKGDTVWLEKHQLIYKYKQINDTVNTTDSIKVPYPVETVKEVNILNKWQIILMCLGGVLIGYLGYKIVRVLR